MCLYPELIQNRKYIPNKKNGGKVPPLPLYVDSEGRIREDKRVLLVPVGCGRCMECRKRKGREWNVRLHEELRTKEKVIFITLTFSNESIYNITNGLNNKGERIPKRRKRVNGKLQPREYEKPINLEGYELDNEIATIAIRRFLERWRKKFGKSVKHWFITELGHKGTENIHMHGLIWTEEKEQTIKDIWDYGFIWMGDEKKKGYVNERTINYITKYVHKTDLKHREYKSKILCSQGIGSGYLQRLESLRNKYNDIDTIEYYTTRRGIKLALPIYYRNKIYSDQEREKLWTNMLDREVRYVCGEEIDISKGEEGYERIRDYWRKRNIEMGYGTNEKNWNRKLYERRRRMLKQKERLTKGAAACRGGATPSPINSEEEFISSDVGLLLRHQKKTEKELSEIW